MLNKTIYVQVVDKVVSFKPSHVHTPMHGRIERAPNLGADQRGEHHWLKKQIELSTGGLEKELEPTDIH